MSASVVDNLAEAFGIETQHDRMPNGELRFRLFGEDGNGYVRVVSGPKGAWQNSHFHRQVRETYIVERGWMALVEFDSELNQARFTRFDPGGIVTTEPYRKHNVYLPAEAVIHVVKHGSASRDADWNASPDLDTVTKGLSEAQLLELVKQRP